MIRLGRIVAFVVKNASEHRGKASAPSVLPRVFSPQEITLKDSSVLEKLGYDEDLEIERKEINNAVNDVVDKINTLPQSRIDELFEAFSFSCGGAKKGEKAIPPLRGGIESGVITRFPPEPNGYLHIGHAKAAFIDLAYARKYGGRFILRFDDTNPSKESSIYYTVQREDLKALGIEWDKEHCTSDDIEKLYEFCGRGIKNGLLYVCTCTQEKIREGRKTGKSCECRNRSSEENLADFESMLNGSLNAIVRLRGDLTSKNTALRDPTMFRIMEDNHPRQGDRYRVWPTYDFAGPIEDSISGVTHAFRSKEYELRDSVYFMILESLGLRKPVLMEFSRLEIKDMPISKRIMKPMIERKEVEGWDDIRLPTIRGLLRRGIRPEAIKDFVLAMGTSKSESKPSIGILESINRKLLDPVAKRYFFVPDPIKLEVKNAPELRVGIKLHPSEDLGERELNTKGIFYVSRNDIGEGGEIRLKDLYNIRIDRIEDDRASGEFVSMKMKGREKKIQWVTEDSFEIRVIKSEGLLKDDRVISIKTIEGLLERAGEEIRENEVVQFERFGFCRRDSKEIFCFAHR